jgi:hypothetical protein
MFLREGNTSVPECGNMAKALIFITDHKISLESYRSELGKKIKEHCTFKRHSNIDGFQSS